MILLLIKADVAVCVFTDCVLRNPFCIASLLAVQRKKLLAYTSAKSEKRRRFGGQCIFRGVGGHLLQIAVQGFAAAEQVWRLLLDCRIPFRLELRPKLWLLHKSLDSQLSV